MSRMPKAPTSLVSVCSAVLVTTVLASAKLAADTVTVELKTSAGNIVLELDAAKAPKTVANFVNYVNKGHYDGTVFHRVIRGFMIQGGGMTADLKEKPTDPPIINESTNGLKNQPYTIAMARTSLPNSATSQFFINHANNSFLDRAEAQDGVGYAVFGRVKEGQDVVDKIATSATRPQGMHENVPVTPVVIQSAKRISGE